MADVKIVFVTEGTPEAVAAMQQINQSAVAQTQIVGRLGQQHAVNTKALGQFNMALGKAGGLLSGLGIASSAAQFQTLTSAALGAASAINAVAISMAAVTSLRGGLVAVGAALALWTAAEAVALMKAKGQEAAAEANLAAGIDKRAEALLKATVSLADAGKISTATADRIISGIADLPKDANAASAALSKFEGEIRPLMLTKDAFDLQMRSLDAQIEQKRVQAEQVEFATQLNARAADRVKLLKIYSQEEKGLLEQRNQAVAAAADAGVITPAEKLQEENKAQRELLAIEEKRRAIRGSEQAPFFAMMDQLEKQGQIGQFITTPFSGLFTGVSSSIQGLINLTMTWGDALRNIGMSVAQSVIKGFADMVSSWVTSMAMMAAEWIWTHVLLKATLASFHFFARLLGWETTRTQVQQEAAKAPALATNAATASVGSYGASAVVGMALALAAIGAIIGFALGAFETGGYTGGSRGRMAGIVHGEEYVFDAPAVDRIGVGNLEAMRRGDAPRGGGAGDRRKSISYNYFDKQAWADAMFSADRADEFVEHKVRRMLIASR